MPNTFQITQYRYDDAISGEVWDSFPVLYSSLAEARARFANGGEASCFMNTGGSVVITELRPDGVAVREHAAETEAA